MQHFRAVLEEGLLDVLGCCGKEEGECRHKRNNEVYHLKNDSTADRKRKIYLLSF